MLLLHEEQAVAHQAERPHLVAEIIQRRFQRQFVGSHLAKTFLCASLADFSRHTACVLWHRHHSNAIAIKVSLFD